MSAGYRQEPAGGPRLRSDIVDVYVFRRHAGTQSPAAPAKLRHEGEASGGVEFLQLLRASEPLAGTWHPVMGHIEPGETAAACAWRELKEELGLAPTDPALLGLWALEQVHPFYIAAIDSIVLSPRFAAEVAPAWQPRLNHEHTSARWVPAPDVQTMFMWPGQASACREILESLLAPGSLCRERLRVLSPGQRRMRRTDP
jgi:dATP pyrophosphohydrolase